MEHIENRMLIDEYFKQEQDYEDEDYYAYIDEVYEREAEL